MNYDRLNKPLGDSAWAEASVVNGFDAAWDRELFGLEIPPWRKGIVQLVQCAQQHLGVDRVVVADMGCGAAVYARHLLETGIEFEYHGYDHNESVLQATCDRWRFLSHSSVNLHLMDARAANWPIANSSYDIVIWDTTLRFCEDVARAFSESARICRGWVILGRTPIEARTWREDVHYYDMKQPSCDWHFDAAFLSDVARRNGFRLTAGVSRDDTHVLSRDPLPEDMSVVAAPRIERVLHEAYVGERVRRLFERHQGPWCIYGAGEHSRWLFTVLPKALRRRVACFADDGTPPGFTIDGVRVLRPREMATEKLAGILVSSDSAEEMLAMRAREWFSDERRIHRLYEHLPPGPYDKRSPVHPPPPGSRPRSVARTPLSKTCVKGLGHHANQIGRAP